MRPAAAISAIALVCAWVPAAQARVEGPLWDVGSSRVPGQVRGVLPGDFDGDGLTDFVATYIVPKSDGAGFVRWAALFLQGPEGFSEKPLQSLQLDGQAVVLDVADAVPSAAGEELLVAGRDGVRAYVFGGNGFSPELRPVAAAPTFFTVPDGAIAPTFDFARDLSGDGTPEILVPDAGGALLRIWERDPGGAYREAASLPFPLDAEWGSHLENDPVLNRLGQLELKGAYFFPKIFLRDFDADGRTDLLLGIENRLTVYLREEGASLRYRTPPRTFTFEAVPTDEFLRTFRMRKITRVWVEDFDADGRADVYLTEASVRNLVTMDTYSRAYVYYNRGGQFAAAPDQVFEVDGLSETAWSGDLTGDGRPDLLFQYFPFSFTTILRVMVLGSVGVRYALYPSDAASGRLAEDPVTKSVGFSFTAQANSAIWAAYQLWRDYDGDGRPDLMQARGARKISFFYSSASEWAAREQTLEVPASFFVLSSDYNRDGRADLLFRYENLPDQNGLVTSVLSRPSRPVPRAAPRSP